MGSLTVVEPPTPRVHRTDRYWGVLGLGAFFGVLAFLFAEPVYLLAAGGVLAWLVAQEAIFRHDATVIDDTLAISYECSQNAVQPDQSLDVQITATLTDPTQYLLTIAPGWPKYTASSVADRPLTLDPGMNKDTATSQLQFPFAGRYTVGPAEITIASRFRLFVSTLTRSTTTTITVEPEQPDNIHVGQAGDQFAVTFGDHGSGNTGPGMVPAGMRAYMPGDPASRIDWKATARLDDVYVREFEIETDRPLIILLDDRPTPTNTAQTRPADYRRHIASTLVAEANSHGDPIGLYRLTTDGVEVTSRLSADPEQYLTIRDQLYTVPERPATDESTNSDSNKQQISPKISAVATRLDTDRSAFGTTLRQYGRRELNTTQIEESPLAETIRTYLKRQRRDVRVAILTDDQRRAELYDAMKLVGQYSPEVLAFITPSMLFETQTVSDVDRLYSEYAEFEQFRQRIDGFDNITAFEVAPSDSLQTVLARGQNNNA